MVSQIREKEKPFYKHRYESIYIIKKIDKKIKKNLEFIKDCKLSTQANQLAINKHQAPKIIRKRKVSNT